MDNKSGAAQRPSNTDSGRNGCKIGKKNREQRARQRAAVCYFPNGLH